MRDLAKILDFSIKFAETGLSKFNKAFVVGNRFYKNYLDNESWQAFVLDMQTNHLQAYINYCGGSGDELSVGKTNFYPPKMASYGSSSRMIYMLAKDIKNFCFEKKLATKMNSNSKVGYANLDGFLATKNANFYVEAKCREPYYSTASSFSKTYKLLYDMLIKNVKGFDYFLSEKDKVYFKIDNKQINFDLKQMICHLLAIAVENLKNPSDKLTKFLYLIFNPTKIEIVDTNLKPNQELKEKIYAAYQTEIEQCNSIPFNRIYLAILNYLNQTNNLNLTKNQIENIASKFSFTCCDQHNFKSLIINR